MYVAAPIVTSVISTSGRPAGGNLVQIRGAHLTDASLVEFGSNPAGTVEEFPGGTRITVRAPAGAVGPVNVEVTTVGGTNAVTTADLYTYDTVPGMPTDPTVAGGNAQVTASWVVPDDEGSPITGFEVEATVDGAPQPIYSIPVGRPGVSGMPGATDLATVTGIAAGTTVSFWIAAVNAVGTGPWSAASNTARSDSLPQALQAVAATAADGRATVTGRSPPTVAARSPRSPSPRQPPGPRGPPSPSRRSPDRPPTRLPGPPTRRW